MSIIVLFYSTAVLIQLKKVMIKIKDGKSEFLNDQKVQKGIDRKRLNYICAST